MATLVITKGGEWFGLLLVLKVIALCSAEGWTSYQNHPYARYGSHNHGHAMPRRHRNTNQHHSPYHAPYNHGGLFDSPHAYSSHQAPVFSNHRQGHAFNSGSRYGNQLGGHHNSYQPQQDFQGFGTSFSSQVNHHDSFSNSPVIITSSPSPHGHFSDGFSSGHLSDGPYSSGHLSLGTASPISLGPTHAGFLSAASSFRVSDHFAKPSIKKGYKVTEESDESNDDHADQVKHVSSLLQRHSQHHSADDRSSSHGHGGDDKATSFSSFVLHSFKPVKVFAKQPHDHQQDEASNEISHKH